MQGALGFVFGCSVRDVSQDNDFQMSFCLFFLAGRVNASITSERVCSRQILILYYNNSSGEIMK